MAELVELLRVERGSDVNLAKEERRVFRGADTSAEKRT